MKIKDTYEFQIPNWALCALINGDDSGLEDEDEKELESFLMSESASEVDVWDVQEGDPYFCHRPEFGPACDVVDVTGIIFDKEGV